ncbi:uncharacterized protein LOC126897283 [Daktulosphaira vitifoliae]|uniref:uncharacterized protein LOC126897283 n=1 Tax=Daktulosphaira vitifoliae TaxID=58002 RepID=UPI0021AB06B3|nr:uncharacterized protein LOC126897283 [Daktulosphaira vitifoliae]
MMAILKIISGIIATMIIGSSNMNVKSSKQNKDIELRSNLCYSFIFNEPVFNKDNNIVLFSQLVSNYYNRSNYPKDEETNDYDFVFKTSFKQAVTNRTNKYVYLLSKYSEKILNDSTENNTQKVFKLMRRAIYSIKSGLHKRSINIININLFINSLQEQNVENYTNFLKTQDGLPYSISPASKALIICQTPSSLELYESLKPLENFLDIFTSNILTSEELLKILENIIIRIDEEYSNKW